MNPVSKHRLRAALGVLRGFETELDVKATRRLATRSQAAQQWPSASNRIDHIKLLRTRQGAIQSEPKCPFTA